MAEEIITHLSVKILHCKPLGIGMNLPIFQLKVVSDVELRYLLRIILDFEQWFYPN